MDEQRRASLLDDLAAEASRQRDEFLSAAGSAFARFIADNRERLGELGGLVLIDDEPDYLFVTEEGTFRSRTRFQDDDGRWVAESEDIEDPSELVELFNPAELYAAFIDAAEEADEEAASAAEDEGAEDDGAEDAGSEAAEAEAEVDVEGDLIDEDWTVPVPAPETTDEAARLLYDLALTFQERSQWREAQLLDDFGIASEQLASMLGDSKIVEDEDERIWFRASGAFEGEVVPEEDEAGEPVWRTLATADDFVQFYDPTDLFGDLAEAIAERYPHVAPELDDEVPSEAVDG